MANPVLVEVIRGSLVETRHRGAIAVSDAEGKTVFAIGDVASAIFAPSTMSGKACKALTAERGKIADATSPMANTVLPSASLTAIAPRCRVSTSDPRITSTRTGLAMDNHLRLEGLNQMARHGRTCSGHPHLLLGWKRG